MHNVTGNQPFKVLSRSMPFHILLRRNYLTKIENGNCNYIEVTTPKQQEKAH